MNIQDVEMETGMTRANIRYYEKRGFLSPERRENSYRDYSDEDIKTLKRIKLFRQLDIPLEDLTRLESGAVALNTVLEERITSAESELRMTQKQLNFCRKMQAEGASYQNLRVDAYLREFERDEDGEKSYYQLIQEDREPPVMYAERRVAARYIDWFLYIIMAYGLMYLFWRDKVSADYAKQLLGFGLAVVSGLLFMLLIEPVLLAVFGTTFGKWIVGLKVKGLDGRKLTFDRAKERTQSVLFYWIFSWSGPNYERYHAIKSNESMLWESTDEVKAEEFDLRYLIGGCLVAVFLLICIGLINISVYW